MANSISVPSIYGVQNNLKCCATAQMGCSGVPQGLYTKNYLKGMYGYLLDWVSRCETFGAHFPIPYVHQTLIPSCIRK